MPGQVIVLHVPVGKALPAEPGPQRIATTIPAGSHAEKVDVRPSEAKAVRATAKVSGKSDSHQRRENASVRGQSKGSKAVKVAGSSGTKSAPAKKAAAPAKAAHKVAKTAAGGDKIAANASKSKEQ
jgi:membrane-bound lytic murein transglycosylase D